MRAINFLTDKFDHTNITYYYNTSHKFLVILGLKVVIEQVIILDFLEKLIKIIDLLKC